MFILIRCFNHQSSAQSTFYCNLNFHDFYPPALSMVAEAARWRYGEVRLPALITRRLEAGGRIPVRNIPRNLPRLRNLPSAEQLPLVRRRGGSGPLITTTNLPNLPPITARHYLHTKVDQIFLRTRKYFWSECETHKHYAVRHLKVFMKWNKTTIIVRDMLNCCCMLNELLPT